VLHLAGVATSVVACAVSVTDPSLVPGAEPTSAPPQATEPPTGAATETGARDAAAPSDAGRDAARAPAPDAGASPTTPAPKPTAGEVLVTEVMFNPSGSEPDAEWIEVYNAASSPRALTGLVLRDGGGRAHTIGGNVVLGAGRYGVLARLTTAAVLAKVPLAAILYEYGAGAAPTAGVLLANGSTGAITLLNGSTTVAAASYGAFFGTQILTGRSAQLKTLTASAAASAAGWCLSSAIWAAGSDRGTPGAPSDCP
jgi:hypothetical protein